MTVFSPMETLGPIIEFFTMQLSGILTGGMITECSNEYFFCSGILRNIMLLVSSRFSLLPQSYQSSTVNVVTVTPSLIRFMIPSVS